MTENQESLISALGEFSLNNPEASFLPLGEDAVAVEEPWGDESLLLLVPDGDAPVIGSLNALRLPPRFSAVWHRDSSDLEFLYGRVRANTDHLDRRFTLRYRQRTYVCEYSDVSDRVENLARAAVPRTAGPDSAYRNLLSLKSHLRRIEEGDRASPDESRVISFWVREMDLQEEDLVQFAKHINFYMRYFDRRSPIIVIHDELSEEDSTAKLRQYPYGAFPEEISTATLDPFLLGLWESATVTHDSFRRFLYHYQALEYVAFYHLREQTTRQVARLIGAPHGVSRVEDLAAEVLDALVSDRRSDEQKLSDVIQDLVDPQFVWDEIAGHQEFFATETEFDGGFVTDSLIRKGWGYADFKGVWIPKVPDALRKIRNSLVHAREKRMARTILPTNQNERRLQPWQMLIEVIAGQVVGLSRA